MRYSNTIPSAIPIFLRSSNMTAFLRILPLVRVSGISKMAACNQEWLYTINLPQTLTWKSIRISPVMTLDAKNIGIAVVISLLSRIQADMYVILYTFPVSGRHL